MSDATLDRLFARFRDRSDGVALAAVFDATSRELFEVACHLVRDPADAEDLVQTTFLTAIRKKELYDGRAPVRGWLYGILWREGAKVRRSSSRRVDPRELTEREAPDPLDVAAAEELPQAVARALARLPARYREVLDPLIRDAKQPDEIARDLRRSAGTVRSQIHRGLERLRRSLPQGFAPAHAVAAVSIRGLARVRGEVLRAAGMSHAAAIVLPTGGVALGGVIVSKSLLVGATAALAVAVGAWIAVDRSAQAAGMEAAVAVAGSPLRDAAGSRARVVDEPVAAIPHDRSRAEVEPPGSAALAGGSSQDAVKYWLARFAEAPEDWRHGWNVAAEIAALAPDEALRIMTAVWPQLSVPVKEQALKPFVFDGGHVHGLKILDLAARDAALSVQSRAFGYLQAYAFQDFAADFEAYERWARTYRDRPVGDVLTENARKLVGDLMALPPEELGRRVRALERLDLRAGGPAGVDLAATIRAEGGLRVLETCLQLEDVEARSAALEWAKILGPDETWLRAWVLPSVERPESADPSVLHRSFAVLGRPECAWARDPILAYLRSSAGGESFAAARALADIGDPAAIPAMIEILLHDASGKLGYDVGYFGLAKLTGVKWQESHDGAWWLDWWEKNRMRLPAAVRDTAIRR